MKRVRFIYNPSSGETVIAQWLDDIISIYQKQGYTIVPYRLSFLDQEEDMMLDGVDGTYHHILIAGGDGTVNYVVNVMKRLKVDVPVAVLPTGTANDFAKTIGVSDDIAKACKQILAGSVERMDLGCVNGEYFVNVFSCGLFTDISQRTPTFLKNNFGKLAYYLGGLGEIPNFRKMHIRIESDAGSFDGTSLIFFVFNGRTAGQMRLAYLSQIDDGLLDVLIVKGDNPIETFNTVLHFLKRASGDYPSGIVHLKCRELTVYSAKEETTDIDGQPGPTFPVHITCEEGALRILRPRSRNSNFKDI